MVNIGLFKIINLNYICSCGDIKELVASCFVSFAQGPAIHIHLGPVHTLTLSQKEHKVMKLITQCSSFMEIS